MAKKPALLKGILIDPFSKTVSDITYENNLAGIYKTLDCDIIEAVYPKFLGSDSKPLGAKHILYVDEEGLFKIFKDKQKFFYIDDIEQPLAGKALVIKDKNGENDNVTITAEFLKKFVSFPSLDIKFYE